MTDSYLNARVLMTFGVDALRTDGNQYPSLLLNSLGPEIEPMTFTWRRALVSRYDVLHVHWPDHLLDGRARFARRIMMGILLLRLKLLRTPVVRTVHNIESHAGLNSWDRRILNAFERKVTAYIDMNRSTKARHRFDRDSYLIPHGHYRATGDVPAESPAADGRRHLLYFGPIHEYKGVDNLITAFRGSSITDPLHIQGVMKTDKFDLSRLVDGDPRISIEERQVSSERLASLVDGSIAVVLPYSKLDNSGSVIFALSRSRPVVVPSNPATLELQAEFGVGWIVTYEGELTPDSLETAMRLVQGTPRPSFLEMPSREWSVIGESTTAVYHSVLKRRGST